MGDTKVGNIRIKQESLRGPVTQAAPTAPMTTVFTDAVPEINIKLEPGVAMKKEKKDQDVAEKDEVVMEEEEDVGEKEQDVGEKNKDVGEKEEEATDSRADLVTPEPTKEDDTMATADFTVEITPLEGGSQVEEAEEDNDDTTFMIGEMFSQLVGEVEKI